MMQASRSRGWVWLHETNDCAVLTNLVEGAFLGRMVEDRAFFVFLFLIVLAHNYVAIQFFQTYLK